MTAIIKCNKYINLLKKTFMKQSFYAVLHIDSADDAITVLLVGGRVFLALKTNQAKFPNLVPTLDVFQTALSLLDTSVKTKNGSTDIKLALENQSKVV